MNGAKGLNVCLSLNLWYREVTAMARLCRCADLSELSLIAYAMIPNSPELARVYTSLIGSDQYNIISTSLSEWNDRV